MAMQKQGDVFEEYFRKADLDRDGLISGPEAVAFFQGSNLPKQVLAQIWTFADQNRTGFLGKTEFFNALKLVTVAQRKRELTPDIVKAALYGPASAKIPAPQINLAGISVSHPNAAGAAPPASQVRAVAPNMPQNLGSRGIPTSPVTGMNLQYNQTPGSGLTNPPNVTPGVAGSPVQGVVSQGFAQSPMGPNQTNFRGASGAVGTVAAGAPPAMLPERGNTPTQAGLPCGTPGQVASLLTKPPMTSGMMSSGTSAMQPKHSVSQNGFASNFGGDAFSTTTPQVKKDSSVPTSAGGEPVSSASDPVSGSIQSPSNSGPSSFVAQPAAGQHHMVQSHLKHNQVPVRNMPSSGPRAGSPHTSVGQQPQIQWPRPSQTDLQKYTKVFMEVDRDKDGKITGEQARNLFLSWRLPREVLKQVWDLSDQDNDSMLSLREFCIALYLMERFREGRPLPAVLPSNVVHDFPPTVQQTVGHGNAAWGFSQGAQQPSVPAGGRPPRPAGKPPLPVPSPSEIPPKHQKAKVPVVEKHLVDQLSEEEQKSLNLKFQEASEANKKVEELEKEIKESREKMEFYRVKMQELVLYKSRCDSRYNEVAERAAADKTEVEALAKKYEEKYKQSGDVGSKLKVEESTFRDIQEKKMEVYQAIVKLEHDGSAEDLKVNVDRIQSKTEELIKTLNERCKKYGLRAKPTTLLELPFGWQPGIQESAADWDEVWDKFEDEGFAIVKELSHDVENVIAPPRTRTKLLKKEKNLGAENETAEPTSDAASKPVKHDTKNEPVAENGEAGNRKEDIHEGSPVVSPSAKSSHEFVRDERNDGQIGKSDVSSHKGTHSDLGVGDHLPLSADKRFDEPAWGTFDSNDDASSVFSKDTDHDRHADDLFGQGGWDLPPIKTGSSPSGGFLPKLSVFADSVSGTPADGFLPKKSIFDDSVPGTPADSFPPNKSIFTDSVPGTPADGFLPKKSIFTDSVPSTPLYNSSYSPQKGDGPEDRGFNLSRFDSFRSIDSGFNPPERIDSGFNPLERLPRFDSFSSTKDFESQDGGPFRQREAFSRFDSMRSSSDFDYGHRFSSFDDSDPFGSGPFKSSFGSETPKRDDAFGSSEPFRSSLGSETPRSEVEPFGSVEPFRSPMVSETPRADSDPFGSVGPFRSSFGSETPRADADPFGSVGPFGSSPVGSETPRRESDYFAYSGSFKSNYGNETPRSEFDSFGFGGPFGSTFGSETPRHDEPFKSTWGSETPKQGTDNWSAF